MILIRILIILSFALIQKTSDNPGKRIIYNEDFDQSFLDLDYWNYELGDGCPELCGWGNKEYQHYTKENVFVRDEKLVIKATKIGDQYFSGRITTKDKMEFQYGTVEVKAKLPIGLGVWPAIWMLGHDIDENIWPNCGEIDIMEYVGRMPGKIHTTLHTKDSYGVSKNTKISTINDVENGFHVYKMHWNESQIKFSIDDQEIYTFAPNEKTAEIWPFDKPFYLILNLAVGGYFGGFEVDDTIFPQEFIIDYIKVYKDINL
ncbi:glycoside hydrolase, GH16 family [Formosa sp. Hel3_A1_48]|jgi:beta-glucanase (GH16 family)|uniref:glycoside hydrolase family 16 protein n=1 Tax=Formosa sp. Hel3_A1_48 TaxID=1336795 RepID=UPI00084E12B1|nr:glycoside hydrolase family 16 protein [Formosa sp. Hel3_A1_48]AOR26131.1 glycoside hydrolase, GH16 family [Formosa sp. Hel3_A1_48]MDC0950954.1 glycoside hydrolase family 16 protein [Flavobacteriaceae bacterium]